MSVIVNKMLTNYYPKNTPSTIGRKWKKINTIIKNTPVKMHKSNISICALFTNRKKFQKTA